jgi:hypothetical protein
LTDEREIKNAELRRRPARNPVITAEYLLEALNHIHRKQGPMSREEILREIDTLTRLALEPPDPGPK